MNYQKIDSYLAMAIEDITDVNVPSLVVFIHTGENLDQDSIAFLEDLGVTDIEMGQQLFTATLSVNTIDELSELPWIEYLRLSQKLSLKPSGNLNFSLGD